MEARCLIMLFFAVALLVVLWLWMQAGEPQSEIDKKLERMEKESRR